MAYWVWAVGENGSRGRHSVFGLNDGKDGRAPSRDEEDWEKRMGRGDRRLDFGLGSQWCPLDS